MVVIEVPTENPAQVVLVEDDDMIQTLASYRADQPLDIGTLPGRPRGGEHLLGAESVDSVAEVRTMNPISVPEKIARRGVFGEGLNDLLGGPLGTGT